jgi:riboflavin transporter FmnP
MRDGREKRGGEIIGKMTTIAVLAALAAVLMLYTQFPYLPAPFCMFEVSDTVTLVAYALFGFWGALVVTFIKTGLSFLIEGVGFMGIGQLAAFLSSLTYIFGLFLFSHVFKWFKKGFGWRLGAYILITLMVTLVMTLANFIFITPTYMEGRWASCFDSQTVQDVVSNPALTSFGASYAAIIMAIYVPFNVLKGLLVTGTYEVLFNRLIFFLLKRYPSAAKYFSRSTGKDGEKKGTAPASEKAGKTAEPAKAKDDEGK